MIEHVADVIRTMEEFHRLVAPGGTRAHRHSALHRFQLLLRSHAQLAPEQLLASATSAKITAASATTPQARFREISVRVKLLALWRWLGFELLVNTFPRYRRFWEHYLCYVVRGKVMDFEFEVLK